VWAPSLPAIAIVGRIEGVGEIETPPSAARPIDQTPHSDQFDQGSVRLDMSASFVSPSCGGTLPEGSELVAPGMPLERRGDHVD